MKQRIRFLFTLTIVVIAGFAAFIFIRNPVSLYRHVMIMLDPSSDERLNIARKEKEAQIYRQFSEADIAYPPREIFLRVFKNMTAQNSRTEIELWAREEHAESFKLIKTYHVCRASGTVGPKRLKGDGQVPEGFYEISGFNPQSLHFLSLKISYPNKSDEILGDKEGLGGDIYIHGGCSSIGCLAITDDLIKELYVIVLDVKTKGKRPVYVHIYPTRMTAENIKDLKDKAEGLAPFWDNLKQGYDIFERTHIPPRVSVDASGAYSFNH